MPRPTWYNLDEARRDRVLRAAMAEFGTRGYSAGSLNVIAREADVAKGSLFQYFEDKFDFFAHVTEQVSLTVYAAMTPYLDRPRGDRPFIDFFTDLVEVWMDYMESHPLERAISAAATYEVDPQVRQAVRAPVHRLYAQALRPLIAEAVRAGELDTDTDADALIAVLVLLLPHLAVAPFEAGLDATLPIYGTDGPRRREQARRLIAIVLSHAGARKSG